MLSMSVFSNNRVPLKTGIDGRMSPKGLGYGRTELRYKINRFEENRKGKKHPEEMSANSDNLQPKDSLQGRDAGEKAYREGA